MVSSAICSPRATCDKCSLLARALGDISVTIHHNSSMTLFSYCQEGMCPSFAPGTGRADCDSNFRSCGTQRVKANNIYQEYIRDKHHLHMNATRWVTLTAFVKHLGSAGIVRVDETEKGLFIAWIDNSPKALAKAVGVSRLSEWSIYPI